MDTEILASYITWMCAVTGIAVSPEDVGSFGKSEQDNDDHKGQYR